MIDYQRQQPVNQPYAPQPQQPYPPQPAYPGPHAHQQPYAHANPYAQPQPHPYPQRRPVPEAVGDERRMLFAAIDGTITIVAGFALALRIEDDKSIGMFWAVAAACVFGVSFVHHVLGAVLFRTTVGKFLLFTRVVRADDSGRPRFWRAVQRWLLGLTWLPMQPVWSLIGSDGDPYEDGCGLRYVRSKDLR
ncbi:RDD family protein [Streptomyces roseoverticillatus]|uniref:RDD family protein n=1 Tax=Streptomyces roseoverticillatus TaxID=66429 RepID=UPI001F20EBF3|nr:RDD family protein [Streptomyces roseoverticillatus]MCF3102044.1 RDD family protein [Streptomyces roseoverticillatus]